jgi:hypothetical protein
MFPIIAPREPTWPRYRDAELLTAPRARNCPAAGDIDGEPPRTQTTTGCALRSAGRFDGQDAFEGALAHPAHGRVAAGVVPDCSHGLFEGPCLTALPFEIVAAEVVAEYVPWPWVEQVPGAYKI